MGTVLTTNYGQRKAVTAAYFLTERDNLGQRSISQKLLQGEAGPSLDTTPKTISIQGASGRGTEPVVRPSPHYPILHIYESGGTTWRSCDVLLIRLAFASS